MEQQETHINGKFDQQSISGPTEPEAAPQQTEYALTEDERGMLDPLVKNMELLQNDAQAILRAITRHRKLEGQWTLLGDKLVRVDQGRQ